MTLLNSLVKEKLTGEIFHMNEDTYAAVVALNELEFYQVVTPVTRENCHEGYNFEHRYLKNKDKTPLRAHRNGKTRTWVKRPEKFEIPIKRGLYEYGLITENDCENWVIVS